MSSKLKPIMIDLNVGHQLTSISCGHVVVELIKFIAYQRMQIPFAYQWLKQVVNKKKMSENQHVEESYQAENHFRVASSALENLDFMLKSLLLEINSSSMPEEVCIAIGSSPMMCKEAYRLLLPTLCHKPQCHSNLIASDQKIQQNIFMALVTSDKLSPVFYNPIQPTNTYIFIKKKMVNEDVVLTSDSFICYSGCRFSKNTKIVVVDFRTLIKDNVTCCNDFKVYGDAVTGELVNLPLVGEDGDDNEVTYNEIESTDVMKWYQSTYMMKGFKDCIVNGSSVTNMW